MEIHKNCIFGYVSAKKKLFLSQIGWFTRPRTRSLTPRQFVSSVSSSAAAALQFFDFPPYP